MEDVDRVAQLDFVPREVVVHLVEGSDVGDIALEDLQAARVVVVVGSVLVVVHGVGVLQREWTQLPEEFLMGFLALLGGVVVFVLVDSVEPVDLHNGGGHLGEGGFGGADLGGPGLGELDEDFNGVRGRPSCGAEPERGFFDGGEVPGGGVDEVGEGVVPVLADGGEVVVEGADGEDFLDVLGLDVGLEAAFQCCGGEDAGVGGDEVVVGPEGELLDLVGVGFREENWHFGG